MIDVSAEVNTRVSDALHARFSRIDVADDYVKIPSEFPHVSVTEEDNTDILSKFTNRDKPAMLVYHVNVYSNKKTGAKLEARAILKIADETMQNIGLWRTMTRQVPNVDRTIYRLIARYRAVVGEPTQVGNDLVFHIYQK